MAGDWSPHEIHGGDFEVGLDMQGTRPSLPAQEHPATKRAHARKGNWQEQIDIIYDKKMLDWWQESVVVGTYKKKPK